MDEMFKSGEKKVVVYQPSEACVSNEFLKKRREVPLASNKRRRYDFILNRYIEIPPDMRVERWRPGKYIPDK